ncbi:MAG: hypothetical protein TREMPRED_006039 [Tremellales sp. Tagirdzhanova-0007]|nr:MAG: hypothetical protein TREMPRED_006039 [Tremellales sp. Tagirdzhanova-0007]
MSATIPASYFTPLQYVLEMTKPIILNYGTDRPNIYPVILPIQRNMKSYVDLLRALPELGAKIAENSNKCIPPLPASLTPVLLRTIPFALAHCPTLIYQANKDKNVDLYAKLDHWYSEYVGGTSEEGRGPTTKSRATIVGTADLEMTSEPQDSELLGPEVSMDTLMGASPSHEAEADPQSAIYGNIKLSKLPSPDVAEYDSDLHFVVDCALILHLCVRDAFYKALGPATHKQAESDLYTSITKMDIGRKVPCCFARAAIKAISEGARHLVAAKDIGREQCLRKMTNIRYLDVVATDLVLEVNRIIGGFLKKTDEKADFDLKSKVRVLCRKSIFHQY